MQQRYYCPECRRQFAKPDGPLLPFTGTHCPACGGQYLTLVAFEPAFPGGDFDPADRWRPRQGLAPEIPYDPLHIPSVLLQDAGACPAAPAEDAYADQLSAFLGVPL